MLVECQSACDLRSLTATDRYGVEISHHVKQDGLAIRMDINRCPGSLVRLEVEHATGLQGKVFVTGEAGIFL